MMWKFVNGELVEMTKVEAAAFVAAQETSKPTLDQIKADALATIDTEHAARLRRLTGDATPEERDTWTVKAAAAAAFLAGTQTTAQAAMIEAEASGSGVTAAQLAQVIDAKAQAFMSLVGLAAGLRSKGRTAIKEAIDAEAVAGALAVLKAEAAATEASIFT